MIIRVHPVARPERNSRNIYRSENCFEIRYRENLKADFYLRAFPVNRIMLDVLDTSVIMYIALRQ
jgi:hypothetical protein